jgi:hypothetical protein
VRGIFIVALLGIAAASGPILFANRGSAECALAVAVPPDVAKRGFSYGFECGKPDAATAAAIALERCQKTKDAAKSEYLRSLCKVIQNFHDQCVAVAWDPAPGTPGVGWAVADDKREAERQAVSKCEQTAGPARRAACVVDHSRCEGAANNEAPPQSN